MPYTPYLTLADFQTDSCGVDLSAIPPTEQAGILRRASLSVDRYCRTSFQWAYTPDEAHDWPMQDNHAQAYGELYPYRPVIRSVQSLRIEVGVNTNGVPMYAEVPTNPTPPGPDGALPPHSSGQVWLDRRRGFIQPVYILLKFGIFAALPSLGLRPPQAMLAYTSGYDRGDGPTSTPVLGTPTAGGAVDPGTHVWAVSYTNANGETLIGPLTAAETISTGTQTQPLTLPIGPSGTTARTVYRSLAGTAFPLYQVAVVADNTTTAYTDTAADAALGVEGQGDGYSIPVPFELIEATRLIAANLAAQRTLANQGMASLDALQIADVKMQRRADASVITPDVAGLLRQFRLLSVA